MQFSLDDSAAHLRMVGARRGSGVCPDMRRGLEGSASEDRRFWGFQRLLATNLVGYDGGHILFDKQRRHQYLHRDVAVAQPDSTRRLRLGQRVWVDAQSFAARRASLEHSLDTRSRLQRQY